jgi:4'-phosphopantetheinyl transferase
VTLEPGVADFWRVDLDAIDRYEGLLSPAERERVSSFRSDPARTRWQRSRGILRELLGRYLGRDPRAVEFAIGPKGKPVLAGPDSLQFNLSHSAGTALYAFALDNPIGVDIELLDRRVRDALGAAARVLGEEETERLRSLPDEQRDAEFLRSWVRHEAALKCRGAGLGSPARPDGLCIRDLDVGADAVAAVALEREPRELRPRTLEPVGEPG